MFSVNLKAQGASCVTSNLVAVNTEMVGSINDAVVNDVAASSCNGQSTQRDGWFSFVATGTEATVRVTANRNPILYAYSGTCSNLVLINCANSTTTSGGNQTETLNLTGLISDNTYFIRIANANNNNNMSISSFIILTNDNCSGAIPLTVNAGTNCSSVTQGSTLGATLSLAQSCGGNTDDDVWYSFVATQNAHTITATAGDINDIVLDLRSGGCNGTNIFCADNTSWLNSETITATGLTVGATYYIRVYSYGNSTSVGSFTICVRETNNCIVYAPTSITASTTAVCVGGSTTLTAVGGTTTASTLWFEGDCGNVGYAHEWQTQPFTTYQTTVNSVSTGILNVTSTGGDPQISMYNIGSFSPIVYKNIAVRYRKISGTLGDVQIYFTNTAFSEANASQVMTAPLSNDTNWHIVNVNMAAHPNWTNSNIRGWRFDYTSIPVGAVRMEIDYIALTDRPVLENTNANENIITVTPTALTTDYYAMRIAESTCLATTACTSLKIYRGKTWNGGPTGDWSIASNWIPFGVPTADDCIEVGNSLTMAISGSHAVGKTLNVSGGNFTVNAGSSVTLKEALTVASGATFTLDDTASLVQEGTTNTNSGSISVKRTAKPMKRYDFTYWSSPVSSQTLYNLSPATLGDKYYSWNPISQAWLTHYNGTDTMIDGKGYIVRAPQSFPIDVVSSTNFVGTFSGKPNSGDITTDVKGNLSTVATDFKWNLIGNPYPSAINLNKFLTDNALKINGTVYLWTHNSPPNNAIPGDATYNYTASDYAAYNVVGGTATSAATVDPLHPIINPSPNTNVPNGFLASGQSFFVRGKADATVKFTNDMREKVGNNQFFRQSNVTDSNIENNRFWLNLRNDEGAFNQALIGYIEGATNDFEDNFDGELFGGNYVTIYSLNSNKQLTIQGRALPFENTDVVPLGLKTTIAGSFSISLDNFQGLFLGQNIFLKDKLLNVIHDLKTGGYTFTTSIGTFEDRFEIVYQNEALGISNPEFNPNTIVIYKKDKTIIVNSGLTSIDNLQVFDIQGRLLYDAKNINSSEKIIKNLPTTDQVLIIQVQTSEGNKISKKIIY